MSLKCRFCGTAGPHFCMACSRHVIVVPIHGRDDGYGEPSERYQDIHGFGFGCSPEGAVREQVSPGVWVDVGDKE